MHFRLILPMIIAVLLVSQKFSDSYHVKFTIKRHNERSVEESYSLACGCNGQTRGAKLKKNIMTKLFRSVQNRYFCEEEELHYCGWLRECEKCIGYMNKCTTLPSPGSGYDCTTKTFVILKTNGIHSKETNGSYGVLRRNPRQTSACFHPPLQTSDLYFVEYPNSISVKQKCLFGYTLDEGITRELQCVYAENEWKPTGFEECRPFLDCSIELISSGHLECLTATPEKAPECNITCDSYEDKTGEPKHTYECQIEGGWKPKLPFCATRIRAGIDLVPAPKIRSHSEIQQRQKPDKPLKKLPNIKRRKQAYPSMV